MKEIIIPIELNGFIEFINDVSNFDIDKYVSSENDEKIMGTVKDNYDFKCDLQQNNLNFKNTLLLYGNSGCGKNIFVKYIAYNVNVPIIYINCNSLIANTLGETINNIYKIFKFTYDKDCIIFFDYIDSIGISRDILEVGELSKTVIALSFYISNYINQNQIFIAATDREDILDLTLKSKFAIKHKLSEPNRSLREELIKTYMHLIDESMFDMKRFLDYTAGFSYEQVVNELTPFIIDKFKENKKGSI